MPSPRKRALASTLLTLGAAAILVVVVRNSYAGPPPAPIASAPVRCPQSPVNLADRHVSVGSPLPDDLTCADLRGAVFDGINLAQATLVGADAEGASFRKADLTQADLSGADLRGAHFDGAELTQATLVGADATTASFRNADLEQVEASGVRLRGADLNSANLGQATLRDADLRLADLDFADLTQATLDRADLRGASLWLTGSIQTGTGSVRIGVVESGVVQLPYLLALFMLYVMVRRTVRLFLVDLDQPLKTHKPGQLVVSLLTLVGFYAAATAIVALVVGQLVSVWLVDPLLPCVVTGVVWLLLSLVAAMGPEPAATGSRLRSPLEMRTARVIQQRGDREAKSDATL